MRKILGFILMVGVMATPLAARAADDTESGADMQKLNERLQNAATTLEQIESVKLKAIPDWIASKAQCIAVVPGLIKGAFIVGAEYGQGVATCRTAHGWSGPVFIRMAGGSWGFQFGGSGTDLVLVAVNKKGMQDLLQSRFKIGAGVQGAAGPIGRKAEASTNLGLKSELLTYSRSHGLFVGADLNGVTVSQNVGDTVALYGGKYHDFKPILNGHVKPPDNEAAQHFLRVVQQYFSQARENQDENSSPSEH